MRASSTVFFVNYMFFKFDKSTIHDQKSRECARVHLNVPLMPQGGHWALVPWWCWYLILEKALVYQVPAGERTSGVPWCGQTRGLVRPWGLGALVE